MKNNKPILPVVLWLAVAALGVLGAGCFGSDPNQNSQLANPDSAAIGAGGGGTGGASNPNGPIVGNPIATFDTGFNGFVVNPYHDTSQINLGDPNSGVAGSPTLTFDSTDGSPTAGSLEVMAPYSGANQYVDIQNTSMFGTTPANWMGGTLHVRIKADSGSFGGVVEPYAITIPKMFVFGGTSTNFAKGNNDWQEFTVNLTTPGKADTGYDSTQVIIFGMQINSGGSGAAQQPITFHVDSFSVSGIAPPPTGAGGTGGGSGGAAGGSGGAAGGSGGVAGGGGTGAAGSRGDASVGG